MRPNPEPPNSPRRDVFFAPGGFIAVLRFVLFAFVVEPQGDRKGPKTPLCTRYYWVMLPGNLCFHLRKIGHIRSASCFREIGGKG